MPQAKKPTQKQSRTTKRTSSPAKTKASAKTASRSGTASRSRSTASRAGAARSGAGTRGADAAEAARDQLRRFVNPLDLVVLTRERVQEAFDEAVERGRMTRQDASELLTVLLSLGRRQTEDLIAEMEQLLAGSSTRVLREVDRARRATGLGPAFPISGYDDLTAAQVQSRLGDLSPPELRKVRDYERRNANRKSVLQAIDQKLG